MKKFDFLIIIIITCIEIIILLSAINKFNDKNSNERYIELSVKNQVILSEKITAGLEKKYLILSDNNVIDQIINVDLDFEVPKDLKGYDLLYIYNNGVQVINADCPSRVIVGMGFTSQPYKSLICIPRFLVISIIDTAGEIKIIV